MVSSPSHKSSGEQGVGALGGFLEEVVLDLSQNRSQSSRGCLWEEGKMPVEALQYKISHCVG